MVGGLVDTACVCVLQVYITHSHCVCRNYICHLHVQEEPSTNLQSKLITLEYTAAVHRQKDEAPAFLLLCACVYTRPNVISCGQSEENLGNK
jgi:hypothetical protein